MSQDSHTKDELRKSFQAMDRDSPREVAFQKMAMKVLESQTCGTPHPTKEQALAVTQDRHEFRVLPEIKEIQFGHALSSLCLGAVLTGESPDVIGESPR